MDSNKVLGLLTGMLIGAASVVFVLWLCIIMVGGS